MIDIKLLRENPELVKENIRKKFQDQKLFLVDEVIELDKKSRELTLMCDELRMKRNSISKEIGNLMAQGKKDEAESKKKEGGIGQFMIMNGSASFIQKDSMLTLPDCDLL